MKIRQIAMITLFIALLVAGLAIAQQKKAPDQAVQTAKVVINTHGFEPASLDLKANQPAKITFLRQTNDTCATEVVFPDYKIKKELPLNQPVDVEFTPTKPGTMAFACGMNMYQGKIVVK